MIDEEANVHPTKPATPTAALERTPSRSRSRPKTPLSTEREDFFRRLSSPKPRSTGSYKPPKRDVFYESLRPREPDREIPPSEAYTFPLEFYQLSWSQYLALMTGLNKKRLLAGQPELIELLVESGTPMPMPTPIPTQSEDEQSGAESGEVQAAEVGDAENAVAFPIDILKLIASYCASPRRSILAQHRALTSSASPELVHKQKWVCPRSGCFEVNPPNTLACHTCGEVAIPTPRQRRPTSPSISELISQPIAPRAASARARRTAPKLHCGGGPNNREVIAARQKMNFSTPPPNKARSRSLIRERRLTGERPRSRQSSLQNRYRAKTLHMTNIPGGGCSQTSYFLSLSPPAHIVANQQAPLLQKKRGSMPTPTVALRLDHNNRSRSLPSSPRRKKSSSPVPLPRNNGKLKLVPLHREETSGVPKPRVVNFVMARVESEQDGEGFDAPTESEFNEDSDAVVPMRRRTRQRFSPLSHQTQDERDPQNQISENKLRRHRRDSVSMSPVSVHRTSTSAPQPHGGACGSPNATRGISHQYGSTRNSEGIVSQNRAPGATTRGSNFAEPSRLPLALSGNPLARNLTIVTPDDSARTQPGTWSPIDFGGGQHQNRSRSRSGSRPIDLVAAGLLDDVFTSDSSAVDDPVVRSVVGSLAAAAAADAAYAGLTSTASANYALSPHARSSSRAEGDAPLPVHDEVQRDRDGVRDRSSSTNRRAEGQLSFHGENLETSFSSTSSTATVNTQNGESTPPQKVDGNFMHTVNTAGVFFQGSTPIAVAGSGPENISSQSENTGNVSAAASALSLGAQARDSNGVLLNPDSTRSISPSLVPLNPESHMQHSVLSQQSEASLELSDIAPSTQQAKRGSPQAPDASTHSQGAQESKDADLARTAANSPDISDNEEASSPARPIALAPASPVRVRPAKRFVENPSPVTDNEIARSVSPTQSVSSSSGDDEQTVAELASTHTSPVRDNDSTEQDMGNDEHSLTNRSSSEQLGSSLSLSDQLSDEALPRNHSARPQHANLGGSMRMPLGSPIKQPAHPPPTTSTPLRSSQVISPAQRDIVSQLSNSQSDGPSLATCEDSDIVLDARKHAHTVHRPQQGTEDFPRGDNTTEDNSALGRSRAVSSSSSSEGEYNANERPQPLDNGRRGSFKSILLSDSLSYQNRVPDSRQTLSTIDEEDSEESDSDLSLIADSDDSASRFRNGSEEQEESPKATMRRRISPREKEIVEERDEASAPSAALKEPQSEHAHDTRGTGLGVTDGDEDAAFIDGQEIGGDGGAREEAQETTIFPPGTRVRVLCDTPRFRMQTGTVSPLTLTGGGTSPRRVVQFDDGSLGVKSIKLEKLQILGLGASSHSRVDSQHENEMKNVYDEASGGSEHGPAKHDDELGELRSTLESERRTFRLRSVKMGCAVFNLESELERREEELNRLRAETPDNLMPGAVDDLKEENDQLRLKIEKMQKERELKEMEIRKRERSASTEIRCIKKDLETVMSLQNEQLVSARAQSDALKAVACEGILEDKSRRATCGSRVMRWMFNIMMIIVCLWVARSIYMHAHSCRFHCPPRQELSVGCGVCLVEAVLPHRDVAYYL